MKSSFSWMFFHIFCSDAPRTGPLSSLLRFPLTPIYLTDHAGYEVISRASYWILMLNWAIYCFVVGNSFSGCILAFMNVRLYDSPANTLSALEAALHARTFKAGTIRDTLMSMMLDVSAVKQSYDNNIHPHNNFLYYDYTSHIGLKNSFNIRNNRGEISNVRP